MIENTRNWSQAEFLLAFGTSSYGKFCQISSSKSEAYSTSEKSINIQLRSSADFACVTHKFNTSIYKRYVHLHADSL